MNIFKSKEKPIIEFSCREWAIRKYAPVLPASHFFPDEYKRISPGTVCPFDPFHDSSLLTVKLCPALNQYMSYGYVIPAWQDMEIKFDENGGWNMNVANPNYRHSIHPEEQYSGLLESKFKFRTAIKIPNPWSIKTREGYNVMWLPMFYHNTNFQALPAILDFNTIPNDAPINLMFYEKKDTLIKLGDPLVHIIPFKREDITAISREYNQQDEKRFHSLRGLRFLSRFSWKPFIKNKVKFLLNQQDTELE